MIYYKRVAQSYLLDEKTISISGLSIDISEKDRKILQLFIKKRNVSNSEIMALFLEKDKTKDFAVKKKNKTLQARHILHIKKRQLESCLVAPGNI